MRPPWRRRRRRFQMRSGARSVDKAICDIFRSTSNNQMYIELRDDFTFFDRWSRDNDLVDQNCLTSGKHYYCELRELYSGVRALVAIVFGDSTILKDLLQDALIAVRTHCCEPGPLSACLQRDGPWPTKLARFASGHPSGRSICGQDQLRGHRFRSWVVPSGWFPHSSAQDIPGILHPFWQGGKQMGPSRKSGMNWSCHRLPLSSQRLLGERASTARRIGTRRLNNWIRQEKRRRHPHVCCSVEKSQCRERVSKTWRGTEEGNWKLQGHCACICDVLMVRIMHYSPSEKERGPESWKKLHVGGIEGIKLPALASYDGKLAAETLGWQEDRLPMFEAWQCGALHNVFGDHGHQDSVRRGDTEACRTDWGRYSGRSQYPRVDKRWLDWKDRPCSSVWRVSFLSPDAFGNKRNTRFAASCGSTTSGSCHIPSVTSIRCKGICSRS